MDSELPGVEQVPKDVPPSDQMDLDGETTPRPDKGKGKAVVRVINDVPTPNKGKGKGKAVEKKSPGSKKTQFKQPAVRVIFPPWFAARGSDSDSDLEIIAPVTPQSEHRKMLQSLRAVRRASPPKMRKAGELTAKELRAELLFKGRQQVVQEREEQIQELRAKGIIVLTAEERAKETNEVEDLLEKARLESLAIKRREKKMEAKAKDAVKKESGTGGDEDEDDEEDENWLEEAESGSVLDELSGSESEVEEGEGEEGGEEEDKEKGTVNDFSDEEKGSEEDEDDGTASVFSVSSMYHREQASPSTTPRLSEIPAAYIDDEAGDDDSDGGEFAPLKKKSQIKKQQRNKRRVVEEDDDDESDSAMQIAREEQKEREQQLKSKIPTIFQHADAAPAFPGMGMTQLFASTIGASGEVEIQGTQEAITALRRGAGDILPNSQMLDFDGPSQDISQPESSKLRLDYSQSQVWPLESLPRVVLDYEKELEVDDMPDPTQDVGFENGSSQLAPPRFTQSQEDAPDSTQALDGQFEIHRKRRGRLTRRETEFSDVEEEGTTEQVDGEEEEEEEEAVIEEEEEVEDIVENVFDLMKKASKKKSKIDPVDMEKLKADTKGLVHEQAEESEDEYAGIGGASDDEADAGHDSEMEDMMDDTNNETVDEAAIAAYYAEKEKVQDEKDVNKLLKDLQSGLLRKKRGAEFDLDDSDDDDDGEARRRAKRRQMAKMRKELMKDGNIEKIASNPKRQAFLSAIEDRDRDEEMDFLDRGEEDLFVELGMVSQSQAVSQSQEVSHSLETSQSPDQGNSDNEGSPTPGLMEEDLQSQSKEASREVTPLPIPQSKRPVKNKASTLAHVRQVSLVLCMRVIAYD